ncbi:MAG: glycosyltransferase family 39 protein [Terracidiphilus sp.]
MGLSPYPLFEGTEFQYTPFDYLWWVLAAYFTIRLLKSENPRWRLAIGAAVGLGLLTKYSILFFVAGIIAEVVFSSASRHLRSGWFWCGLGVSLLIFPPDFLWEAQHKFVTYTFLQSIQVRDVTNGISNNCLGQQLLNCINPVAAPLCMAKNTDCGRIPPPTWLKRTSQTAMWRVSIPTSKASPMKKAGSIRTSSCAVLRGCPGPNSERTSSILAESNSFCKPEALPVKAAVQFSISGGLSDFRPFQTEPFRPPAKRRLLIGGDSLLLRPVVRAYPKGADKNPLTNK